jgi:gamma-tubulin complex component 3
LDRLDVKLLEYQQGDRGWEVFQLDYRVNDLAPLSTIFTQEVMNDYLKIFSFMWKLKKIQHSLSVAWGLTMAYRTPFSRLPASLQSKFHRFNLAHHEMSHFVTNVHNYILVEVLESAWTVFLNKLRTVADLDSLIML